METTGNTITVNVFIGGEMKDVPVMRNGKPTKRMKRQYVANYEDRVLTGIMVQGHEIFIDEREASFQNIYMAFKGDGERLMVACKYGNYGSQLHMAAGFYDAKSNMITVMDRGWDGPMGKGRGARIVKINW